MRQLNFLLIFSFGLAMVMFTLENTAATTVHFLPGISFSLPLAALLLLAAGVGATAAWIFAVWNGVVRKVETLQDQGEREAQAVRIQELENDLDRYRATVDAQLGLLPAAGGSSGGGREAASGDEGGEGGVAVVD
jgi:uncharacterized integral membrane protein